MYKIQNSRIETYKRMWEFMDLNAEDSWVHSTEEGHAKVKDGNYAFLLESTMNEYIHARDCSLTNVGGLLDNKGYGIGTQIGILVHIYGSLSLKYCFGLKDKYM